MPISKGGKSRTQGGKKGVDYGTPIKPQFTPPLIAIGDINLTVNIKPIQRSILEMVRDKVAIKRMALNLSREPNTIRYHLRQLEKFNLISNSGRESYLGVWRITNEGKQFLLGGGKIKKRALTSPPKIVDSNRLLVSQDEPKKQELTDLEKQVLKLLQKGRSQNSIALELELSKQRISTIRRNIEKKIAVLELGGHKGAEASTLSPPHEIRLHKEQWRLVILAKSPEFDSLRTSYMSQDKEKKKINKNTVKVWRNVIEVYSNTYFLADTPKEATSKALEYWENFFRLLETRFKVTLFGEGKDNIKRVRQEYAEINNELSKQYNKKDVKVKIYSKAGKLWFIFDNSFNLSEAEAVDPEKAEEDITKLTTWFNDIRDNEVLPPTQIQSVVNSLAHNLSSFQNQVFNALSSQRELESIKARQIDSLSMATGNLAKVSSSHEAILFKIMESRAVVPKSTDNNGNEFDPKNSSIFM